MACCFAPAAGSVHEQGGFVVVQHGRQAACTSHSASDFGVHVGGAVLPSSKDQDRYAMKHYEDFDQRQRKEQIAQDVYLPVIGFGLYDGHGLSSVVSDRCQTQLLAGIAQELQAEPPQSGGQDNGEGVYVVANEADTPQKQSQCIRRAFRKFQQSLRLEFSDKRVGSTATCVLLAPATHCEQRAYLAKQRSGGWFYRSPNAELESEARRLDLCPSAFVAGAGDDMEGLSTTGVENSSEEEEEEEQVVNCWRLTCAWVGDSRAIVMMPDGSVQSLSTDHRLEVLRERMRVTEVCSMCNAESELGLRHTVVARRQCTKTGQMGPEVIFNETTGVSLMVTRTLGDCLGPTACISDPDVFSMVVPEGCRVILASDGLWDVFDNQQVAAFVQKTRDPRKAAVTLAQRAKKRRLYGGMSMDDISVLVVDI